MIAHVGEPTKDWTFEKMDIRPIFFKEIGFTISLEYIVSCL